MPISPLFLTVVLLLLVFVVCVLGVMAVVRSADEAVDAQWEELRRMRSDSGREFFPTSDAPRELELAIADAVELAPPRARPRAKRRAPSWRLAGP